MSRNSSKRQLKVPARFYDSIHDLDSKMKNQTVNKKKNKECLVKDTSVGNKSIDGNTSNQSGAGNKMINEELIKDGVEINKTAAVNGDQVEKESVENAGKEELRNGNEQIECTANTPDAAPNVSTSSKDNVKNSYADVTNKNIPLFDGKLKLIPTEVDDSGNEFVIFDDEMVKTGSSRWLLTLCGHFLGHQMSVNELRFNLRGMWGRHGFKEVIDSDNGMFFFKFHHEEGLRFVVENGPWMVNNKPLVVQRWDVSMNIEKTEPDVLPLWVKLCNIPLEAWTVNGISALASRIGKPLIIDAMTASMCKIGVGRVGYARVLVEVSKPQSSSIKK